MMLLVFDWDGTLIDSTGKIVRSMQEAMGLCGFPLLPDDAVRNIIGLGLPEAILELYPEAPEADRILLQKAYSECYVAADQVPCVFYPGVEECLDALQHAGHKIAVATGKSRRGLDRVLHNTGWQDRFDATRCADETASKPDPKMLFELMAELGAGEAETCMVGDTEYDLLMAVRAGVNRVGVSYGAHEPVRLLKHSPLAIVDDMRELLSLISK